MVQVSYPGVYVQELPSGVRTITGASTSVTAFVGRTQRGTLTTPIRCFSFEDFERSCGGLWRHSELGYAVRQFFQNGGGTALISRVATGAGKAISPVLAGSSGTFRLEAENPGSWGNNLRVSVSHGTAGELDELTDTNSFHLTISEVDPTLATSDPSHVVREEFFANVSVDANAPRYVERLVRYQSKLVRVTSVSIGRPVLTSTAPFSTVTDGTTGSDADYTSAINRLSDADGVNIVCVPPPTRDGDISTTVLSAALSFCEGHRAILLLDPPAAWGNYEAAANLAGGFAQFRSANAAYFYPRVLAADPLQEGRLRQFAPSGFIAGVMARTDAERGLWKAAAGVSATLVGVQELAVNPTDGETGLLNSRGVNALRSIPLAGPVVWGGRSARGADVLADEWKYLSVRRTALYIEQSLQDGLKWAVFEPNDEPLWTQIRLAVGTFMQQMFRQGAFQGTSPRDAYLVKCDGNTTIQDDIDRGIVNIVVGFAPLKPAEFVVLKFQQLTGQSGP